MITCFNSSSDPSCVAAKVKGSSIARVINCMLSDAVQTANLYWDGTQWGGFYYWDGAGRTRTCVDGTAIVLKLQ